MIKQNPFSVYDFLGYFIPGALMIYLYVIIDNLKNPFSSFHELINSTKDFQIDQLMLFIIISYSLGHLINFVSSMTIEKYALWKYDYPSKFLLDLPTRKYWRKNTWSGYLWRIVLPIIILPVSFFDIIIGEIFNLKDIYTRRLDYLLVKVIRHKAINLMKILYKNAGAKDEELDISQFDFFRVLAHYAYENSKNHQSKLSNYVALYGFLRTLTLISIICFWYSINSTINENSCLINFNTVIIFGVVSYIFFMAFMKFYRRYTLEGLMVIAIDPQVEKDEEKKCL